MDIAWYKSCFHTIYIVLKLYPWWIQLGLFIVPIFNSLLNLNINNLLQKKFNTMEDVVHFLVKKVSYEILSSIVMSYILHYEVTKMRNNLMYRLEMAKIKCAIAIPGESNTKFKELREDSTKLRDFLFVIPLLWSSLITFFITIVNIQNSGGYPLRLLFTIFCVVMFVLMTLITDNKLYEITKPNSTTITRFSESNKVKIKLHMGCNIDSNFESDKHKKRHEQHQIQKYLLCIINLVITLISLKSGVLSQIHSFSNIAWMISCLSDNIKSLQYKDYVNQFLELCILFEKHTYKSKNETPVNQIQSVRFVNVNFGYFNSLDDDKAQIDIIKNLTVEFTIGKLYYLEGSNGKGKSTFLKMFMFNLTSGNIFFDNINRMNISFEDIHKLIFQVYQASEYMPIFSKKEIEHFQGKDSWLEKQLGLEKLFKDSSEISGGQKKRMLIYLTLVSNCPILLLDEILSELSTEETFEVPEGGGWLTRVINTIVYWKGRESKIIILVGHGLVELIPNEYTISKLKINEIDKKTILET